ncbi:MAG TPA: hypothetical protein VGV35_18085 [Bryobacteraceae bacterium]|nr:hypothetical protein [Bryobacteraceae bacterium]
MFRLGRFVSILATPVFAALLLNAQPQQDDKDKPSGAGKDTTIVGCLAKGEQPDTYQIKATDKTYVLTGKKEDLEKHVGKQVSISGAISDDKLPGAPADAVKFRVSAVSKVADSCQ